MRLLVDAQPMQSASSRQRGIGRYTVQLLGAMAALRPHWQIELVQSAHLEAPDSGLLPGLPRRTFTPPFPAVPGRNDANERYYADWLTAQAPDAILVCSFFESLGLLPQFVGRRPPLFGILYDLIPLLFADDYFTLATTQAQYAQQLRLMLQADCLFAISEATAQDLRRLFREPLPAVVPIGGAADPAFAPHADADLPAYRERLRSRFGLARDFILYVGGFDHRKNLRGALESFAALPETARQALDFVIACRLTPDQRRLLEGWASDLGIAAQVKLTGYVSDDELRALYQLCRLFFFPSLYEGLGLPVLEALQLGAPVVAPNHSSIPEVAGSVCVLADSCAPADLARAVLTALAEPRDAGVTARRQHAAGFRWDDVASLACQALERPRRAAPVPRRR
ncbi:MAG TPA: glycosyltransferase family 1 protein, partial [Gemmataceae bacterium]|nr:glycosyltransferase family 1 protein [Gemmataceae bacterium]